MSSGPDARFHRASWPMEWVYREDLETALSRCAKRDRDLILGWYDNMKRGQRRRESDAIVHHQTQRDLFVVVRDQANHIANLEAQLMPHLRAAPDAEQDAML